MTLKEKLQQEQLYINPYTFKLTKEGAENLEKIADDYAIGFANYIDDLIGEYGLLGFNKNFGNKSTEELLEMYKKEKEL